jgi:peroxiredoxin
MPITFFSFAPADQTMHRGSEKPSEDARSMRFTRSFKYLILLGISILTASFLATSNSAFALDVGDRAPAFAAPSLDGKGTVELGRYRGKVVYLDFWASWCAPCLTAIPEVEKMRGEFPADEFQVIAINLDTKTKKALRFLEKHPIGYPSASDPKGSLPGQYGVDTMPTSYLIDRDGVIRYVHRGFTRGDGSKLRHEIRALLEAER